MILMVLRLWVKMMSEFLLIVIIGMLVYIIYDRENEKKPKNDKHIVEDILPEMIGKMCEIDFKQWLIYVADDNSIQGVIKDVDDDWVMVETYKKKQSCLKVIKKSLIAGIKEIQS